MPDKLALIVGIENYPVKSGQRKAPFALNDAKAMAEYARAAGFHLIGDRPLLDEDASYSEFVRQLDHMFNFVGRESFVFLYYAGHGYCTEYGGYMIPFDYQHNKGINESSCISFDTINKRVQSKKPDRFVFFLDTCHSGYAVGQIDIRRASSTDIAVTDKSKEKMLEEIKGMVKNESEIGNIGRVVFTSSSPDEKSRVIEKKKHGLFTYFLLSGLKMKSNRKEIDIEEFIKYVKDQVKYYALHHNLKQTPVAYTHIQGKLFLPTYKSREEETIIDVPDLDDSISKVRKAIKAKDYDGAEKLLKILLEQDNLNFEINRLLEEVEVKREKDRTEKEKKKRELFEEWKKRGESFLQSGDYAKAKECFENARKMYPENDNINAFLEGMEPKQKIIKIDDIEVPGGREYEIESFKKGLIKTIFNISVILFFIECVILHRKIFTGEEILFDVWDFTAYTTYSLAILASIFYVSHIADSRIIDSMITDSRINNILVIFLIPFLYLFSLFGLGFIIAFIILIIKLFSKEYIRFILEKFIPSFLIYCIPIFPFVTIFTSSLIVKLTGKRYSAWFAFIPHLAWILFFL